MRRILQITALILVLLLGAAGGAYWYLFSAPSLSADQLVPAETVFFATIPNAVPLLAGYEGSDLKKILDDPTAQAGLASLKDLLGKKYLDALQSFLPELSGQSFLALTHLDPDHPENGSFIAGLKPLPGTDHFDDFLTKFKDACGTQVENWPAGSGSVAGLTYNWFQPPGAPGHLCVLRHQGWILISLGPDALEDWLQRYQKKSTTPSLSQNPNYQTSLQRVGTDNLTLFYLNPARLLSTLVTYLGQHKLMPSLNNSLETYQAFSLIVIGDKFQNGKIVDTSSIFLTPTGKAELGLSDTPCTFDTLKFTDRNTCFYLAGNRDWNQVSQRIQRNFQKMPPAQLAALTMQAQTIKNLGIDLQHNVINALGPEFSIQMDWDADASFPDLGLFFKVDKTDDFQPVIKAIHDLVEKMTSNYGVITELNVNGQKFATFHFAPKEGQLTPTLTENGPYFAFFLTQKYAANCFSRDPNGLLSTNADFQEAVGDKLTHGGNATDLIFLNSPSLLDRAYQAALPFAVLAAQTNPQARTFLRDHEMPKNLSWLAPIGSWTCLDFMDEAGLRGYSYSGVGNQGLFFGSAALATGLVAPGLMPKPAPLAPAPLGETPLHETSGQRAGMVRDELSQLRITILAWAKDKKNRPRHACDLGCPDRLLYSRFAAGTERGQRCPGPLLRSGRGRGTGSGHFDRNEKSFSGSAGKFLDRTTERKYVAGVSPARGPSAQSSSHAAPRTCFTADDQHSAGDAHTCTAIAADHEYRPGDARGRTAITPADDEPRPCDVRGRTAITPADHEPRTGDARARTAIAADDEPRTGDARARTAITPADDEYRTGDARARTAIAAADDQHRSGCSHAARSASTPAHPPR